MNKVVYQNSHLICLKSYLELVNDIKIPSTPPNTTALGTVEKTAVSENDATVKGVMYNQEKTYSGLENQRRYWGEVVIGQLS